MFGLSLSANGAIVRDTDAECFPLLAAEKGLLGELRFSEFPERVVGSWGWDDGNLLEDALLNMDATPAACGPTKPVVLQFESRCWLIDFSRTWRPHTGLGEIGG